MFGRSIPLNKFTVTCHNVDLIYVLPFFVKHNLLNVLLNSVQELVHALAHMETNCVLYKCTIV